MYSGVETRAWAGASKESDKGHERMTGAGRVS